MERFNKITSFVLVLVCIGALLFGLVFYVVKVGCKEQKVERILVYTSAVPDSTMAINYISKEQIDSLIKEVRQYDAQLSEKYQYLIEQKEQDSQLFYWGSLIVGIVVSVVGWFGYQSFSSVEEKAIKAAKESSGDYLAKNLTTEVANQSKTYFESTASNTLKDQIKNDLDAVIQTKVDNLNLVDEVNNLKTELSNTKVGINQTVDAAVQAAIEAMLENYRNIARSEKKGKSNEGEA